MKQSLPKPKIGEKCNGCGLCCQIRVCMNGAYVQRLVMNLGDTVPGPCPALLPNKEGGYSCGILVNPKKYIKGSKYPEEVLRRNFAHLVGAGRGCDQLKEDDTDDEIEALDSILSVTEADQDWHRKNKIAFRVIHSIEL